MIPLAFAASPPPATAPAALPSGACSAFTSTDPAIRAAVDLWAKGKLAEAEQALAGIAGAEGDELREVIARTRREYSLDAAELLKKVNATIPDMTAEDLERWRQRGEAQARTIDGQVRYFRREPSNIFRFCPEAIQRRAAAAGKAEEATKPAWSLEDHLLRVIEEAERTGQVEVAPMRHRIRFKATIPGGASGAHEGSLLRVWLPYPQEYRQQRDVRLIRMSPDGGTIAPNAVDEPDGSISGAPQRTIFFEKRIEDPRQAQSFEVEFEYTSSAYYPRLDDALARPLPKDFPQVYLAERPPHIDFTPEVKETVRQIVGGETNPLKKARRIFHFVDSEIRYCAEEEYSIIPGFASHALKNRKGDCGVQGMLFITLCRAAGIPARWQSGWETKRLNWNMHDWAEFYVEPWGWLPADPSYGLRREGRGATDERIREFYFGHQDSYRLIVNRDYGSDLLPPKHSLRSEPADFQRGEVELDGKNLYYDDWDYDIEFNWLDDGV